MIIGFLLLLTIFGVSGFFLIQQNERLSEIEASVLRIEGRVSDVERNYDKVHQEGVPKILSRRDKEVDSLISSLVSRVEVIETRLTAMESKEEEEETKRKDIPIEEVQHVTTFVEEKQDSYFSDILEKCFKKKKGEVLDPKEEIEYQMLWGLLNEEKRTEFNAACQDN
ncbi:MAG TPA: hypothetical protein PKH10_02880 [bacterium]|nr:hypothetical protein [bacterium]